MPRDISPRLFEEVCDELLLLKKLNNHPHTYVSARNHIRHLLKTFKGVNIFELTHTSFKIHIIRARQERPNRNLNDDRKYFIMLLRHVGIHVGKIPMPNIASSKGRELSEAELQKLFSFARGDLRFQMEIALRTGMRLRETLHLEWRWFDWDRKTLHLPPHKTKTRTGRTFPLPADLLTSFQKRYGSREGDHVFPSPICKNKPIDSTKRSFSRVRRLSGVSCRWHDFRHTCATKMLRAGIQSHIVCKYLGMSEKVLKRIYAHLNTDDLIQASEAVKLSVPA